MDQHLVTLRTHILHKALRLANAANTHITPRVFLRLPRELHYDRSVADEIERGTFVLMCACGALFSAMHDCSIDTYGVPFEGYVSLEAGLLLKLMSGAFDMKDLVAFERALTGHADDSGYIFESVGPSLQEHASSCMRWNAHMLERVLLQEHHHHKALFQQIVQNALAHETVFDPHDFTYR